MAEDTKSPATEPAKKPARKKRAGSKKSASKPKKQAPAKVEAPAPAAPAEPLKVDELAELKQMVSQLVSGQEALQNRLEAKEIENLELSEMVAEMKTGLQEREGEGEVIERDGEILFDEYDSQDPFKIIGSIQPSDSFPEGRVIGWKSPVFRGKRGWRGWFPIEHGDEIAGKNDEFLANYIPDPPDRMKGPDAVDNCIRRGDMVLAWIDARIWTTRQRKRELLARKKVIQTGSGKSQTLRDGVQIIGKGATKAMNPRKEFNIPAPVPTYVTPSGSVDKVRTELPIKRETNKE